MDILWKSKEKKKKSSKKPTISVINSQFHQVFLTAFHINNSKEEIRTKFLHQHEHCPWTITYENWDTFCFVKAASDTFWTQPFPFLSSYHFHWLFNVFPLPEFSHVQLQCITWGSPSLSAQAKKNKSRKVHTSRLQLQRNHWESGTCFGLIYKDIVLKLIKHCLMMNWVWSRLPVRRGGELWAVWAWPKKSHWNNPINNGVRQALDAMTRWARALKSMGGLAPVLIRPGFHPVSFGLLAAHWERGQPREERGWPAGRGSSRISPQQQQLPFSWRSESDEPRVSARRERPWDPNHNKQTQAPILFSSSAWYLEGDVHREAV